MVKTVRLIVFLLLLPCLAMAQITGKVVAVADGDTFTMLLDDNKQVKIRLHGIDCPEKSQDFGTRAKQFTSSLVFGKVVTAEETVKDRYGRTVAIVTLPDGSLLNERLLQAGYAWHYVRYDTRSEWAKMEAEARLDRVGLWQHDNAVAPWEFRKAKRAAYH